MQTSIPEDKPVDHQDSNNHEADDLKVIRPEKGIDKSQFQPIIRKNRQLNIALSPLRVS